MKTALPVAPRAAGELRSPRVLIVDPSEETRTVLRYALERRGVEILEADEAETGLALLRRRCPEVVVLDLESSPDEAGTLTDFNAAIETHAGSLVVLGKVCATEMPAASQPSFAKPYHFAPLILRIEELLAGLTSPQTPES